MAESYRCKQFKLINNNQPGNNIGTINKESAYAINSSPIFTPTIWTNWVYNW